MKYTSVIIHLILGSIFAFCTVASATAGEDCNSVKPNESENANLENILENVGKISASLETLESKIDYLTIQDPDIVESRTLQRGKLYFHKGEGRSQLRIRFDRLQQDDFPAEESVEDYYFDGVWLTKVDYKLQQVSKYQQAPENEPVDVFELINERFPLIGFSGAEALRKDFDVSVAGTSGADPNKPIQLLLEVKKDSKYQDDYKKIDFWIDKNTYLPRRVRAYSTQGDIYDVRFSDVNINKKLKNGVFTIETPSGFRKNVEALETTQ